MNIEQLFVILEFAVLIVIIIALYKIESKIDCNCIENNYKKGLKEWFIFVIVFKLISNLILFIYIIYSKSGLPWNPIFLFVLLNIPISIINIIMFVRLFLYLRFLKESCKCAFDNKEKFIYYYLIVYFSFILFGIVISIISLLAFSFLIYNNKSFSIFFNRNGKKN